MLFQLYEGFFYLRLFLIIRTGPLIGELGVVDLFGLFGYVRNSFVEYFCLYLPFNYYFVLFYLISDLEFIL